MKNYYVLCNTKIGTTLWLKTKATSKREARANVKKVYKNIKSTVRASLEKPSPKLVGKEISLHQDITNNNGWLYEKPYKNRALVAFK
ncbi:MAG: hypothetical protein K0R18_317 [Bacillales bacterium]|nr:hypothetical protein [Bacillales bacterium]